VFYIIQNAKIALLIARKSAFFVEKTSFLVSIFHLSFIR